MVLRVCFGESKNGFLIRDSADFTVERNTKSEKKFCNLGNLANSFEIAVSKLMCFLLLTKTVMKLWKHDFFVNSNSENKSLGVNHTTSEEEARKSLWSVADRELWPTRSRAYRVYKRVCKATAVNFCHRFNNLPSGQKVREENEKYEEMRSFPGVNTNAGAVKGD